MTGSNYSERAGQADKLRRFISLVKLRREDRVALCSSIEKLSDLGSLYIASREVEQVNG